VMEKVSDEELEKMMKIMNRAISIAEEYIRDRILEVVHYIEINLEKCLLLILMEALKEAKRSRDGKEQQV